MYEDHFDSSGTLRTEQFTAGFTEFMRFASNQDMTRQSRKMFCPCSQCLNNIIVNVEEVWNHIYLHWFKPNYKVWCYHGEDNSANRASTSEFAAPSVEEPIMVEEHICTVQMVTDAFRENISSFMEEGDRIEEPNLEARRFFYMLDASKRLIYEGCRVGDSPLSAATRLMAIKTYWNFSEDCVDAIADFVKSLLPEDNLCPGSYNEIEKLVSGLGLPYEVVDVCSDNCMIYWRRDANIQTCRFCRKPQFMETSGRVRVIWYLPLADRLKRLYQSEHTAGPMRWHAEDSNEGEIVHPSDAEAWKHFN